MRTTWRSFSSSLFASSLFSSLQAGGGEHTRPPVHPLQLKEQRVPRSLSLPIPQLSLTATGFSLLRALQLSLTFVISASATVALCVWWDSHTISKCARH